ncbi:FtsQ-type POTRA domain-containing protein [Candidatus Gracilibacteria bacterium]|nr:FtsQ-type POTRA domain-containing protein [Candidatus Gracilibacteria bacterium]NUJ98483.1 FtsQ-type POTRA domain-containing protein [Candidatus Gracilibacteria bacterium]
MINKIKRALKKIKNYKFRQKQKKLRKKIFVPHIQSEKSFKKRKTKINIKFPPLFQIENIKKNLKYYILGAIFFVVFSLVFLFFGPFFKVVNIDILRYENITNINIAYKSVEDIRNTPLLLIDGKNIATKLKNYQKNIKEVKIRRIFPDTLKITIESYKGVFNTIINEKEYIITENGVFIPSKFSTELKEIKLGGIEGKVSGILDYKEIFKSEEIKKIISIQHKINANLIIIGIESIYYFPTEREVHIDLKTGTKLIFDLMGDIDEQIKKLLIFHKEQFNLKEMVFSYIDLRIKNKIFFCSQEEKNNCILNLKNIYSY